MPYKVTNKLIRGFFLLPSLKPTWHLKITHWKRRFLLETIIFRCYVSLRECKYMIFLVSLVGYSSNFSEFWMEENHLYHHCFFEKKTFFWHPLTVIQKVDGPPPFPFKVVQYAFTNSLARSGGGASWLQAWNSRLGHGFNHTLPETNIHIPS